MGRASWLKKETDLWVEKEIISREQAGQIVALYPQDNKNRLISILLILGAILLGAGIILFFASNWQYLPKWLKVGLVIVPLISFHISSQLMHSKYPKLSATLSLLGCIMFGAGIWLIAQIYHINAHFPNGLLFWFLGVLPVAFFLREPLPLSLSSLLLGFWVVAERSSSPATIFMALFFFAVVFYLTYSMPSPFALAAVIISAVAFVATEIFLILENNNNASDLAFSVFIVLLLCGQLLTRLSRHPVNQISYFAVIFEITGIIISGIALFAMSFEFVARGFYEMHNMNMAAFWILYLLAASAGLYLAFRDRAGLIAKVKENLVWMVMLLVIFILLIAPVSKMAIMITLNLLMFVWALSVIISGYQKQNSVYFTLGIFAFLIFTTTEYFNFFWQMLPKSLFFIVGGLVLIVGGSLLEHQRRKVIHSWEEVVTGL
ncbi:MAG: hypothetical protein VR69_07000 [Peptococcaceae bacterium BRH_c4b]|nr:MAG: hypothetical protein VR69_07000 [Peptococcaceae bacterium BRH_c4b]